MPLEASTTPWPGDPVFELIALSRIGKERSSNTSCVTIGTHTGTHIDAPWHYERAGKRLHEVDPALFFGQALVLDFTGVQRISAEMLRGRRLLKRLLFKTDASAHPHDAPFDEHYPSITADAATYLVQQGVTLVGIDSPSIAPFKEPGRDTHHLLLQEEVLIVENLRLGAVDAGVHAFVVLPLPIVGADGSPCRAFIGGEDVGV
jgi:arylformamidase